jgi:hypothetical protein
MGRERRRIAESQLEPLAAGLLLVGSRYPGSRALGVVQNHSLLGSHHEDARPTQNHDLPPRRKARILTVEAFEWETVLRFPDTEEIRDVQLRMGSVWR